MHGRNEEEDETKAGRKDGGHKEERKAIRKGCSQEEGERRQEGIRAE